LAIHRHVIAPPWQCDHSHRCHRCYCSAVVLALALAAYTLALSPSHGIIALPCLGNATSHVAVAAAAAIAVVIAIATVATTTRVPHSAFSFAPWCSPSAGELCSGCASTSFVGHVHPCFVAITQRHRIALPWQCDPHVAVAATATTTIIAVASPSPLSPSRRHCHCGNHHHGATQRRTQPTRQHHCAARGLGRPSGVMRKGLGNEG